MSHNEFNWKSTKGADIYAQCWLPDDSPVGVINFIHNLGEHSGRYEHWAALFAKAGFAFFALDYRGHGKSNGKRGHTSFKRIMEDIDLLYKKTSKIYRDIPVLFYGHGMGGSLAMNYVIDYHPKINGVIASSPWLRLRYRPTIFRSKIIKLFAKTFPFITFNSGIKENRLEGDQPIYNNFNQDKLLHHKLSAKLFYDARKKGSSALKHMYKINAPMLIMYGENDRMSSIKSCKRYANNASEKTIFKVWENKSHNFHNEHGNLAIFSYISGWITEHCYPINAEVKSNELIQN